MSLATTIYNAAMTTAESAVRLVGKAGIAEGKLHLYAEAQRDIIRNIAEQLKGRQRPFAWVHAASLGEYAVARPLIRRLRQESGQGVLLTFFSPTGYEALKEQGAEEGVQVCYLPLDTRENARRFLDLAQPKRAVFIISELWPNYLRELKERHVPTYLVSALLTPKSPCLRWYGAALRDALKAFTHIMALDEQTQSILHGLGCTSVSVTGDPLFDNALSVAASQRENAIVRSFSRLGNVFIAGSVSDSNDLRLVCSLANKHPETRFLLVPHEISKESLRRMQYELQGKARLYSQCTPQTDFTDTQCLIIDYIGDLPYLYRYARWAYVGGGFTRLLHSVIEPVVYGLPVAYGPRIERKTTPRQLQRLGVGSVVRTSGELEDWFLRLRDNEGEMERVRKAATEYAKLSSGATPLIVERITKGE